MAGQSSRVAVKISIAAGIPEFLKTRSVINSYFGDDVRGLWLA